MTKNDCIDVLCLVLPTGETLWMEQKDVDLPAVLRKWETEHPEFKDTPCTAAAALITMPRERYMSITANFGPGCFEWPK